MSKKIFLYTIGVCMLLIGTSGKGWAQKTGVVDYTAPIEYIIRKITVETPSEKINKDVVKKLSGLAENEKIKIPGEDISRTVERLWDQEVFSNVKIYQENAAAGYTDIVIYVEEKPRLSRFKIKGVKKSEADDIKEHIGLFRGAVMTDYLIKNTEYKIKDFLADKNYFDAEVDFDECLDTLPGGIPDAILLTINIDKKDKVRVGRITFAGNEHVKLSKIRKALKDAMYEKSRFDVFQDIADVIKGKKKFKTVDSTVLEEGFYPSVYDYFRNAVRINIFTSSKYNKNEVEPAKDRVIDLFNAKGYRDAKFVKDSIYLKEGDIYADFRVDEGKKYFFRNISWVGNKRYRSGQLDTVLNIRRGDVYNLDKLNQGLHFSQSGFDVTSLYQDNGYLFFSADPVEVKVAGDSIDLEIRIYEGKQARVGRINIIGNSKTNDYVVLREIRIQPGDLFNRSAIIRSQQALSQLGIFDAQNMDVRPRPNPTDGTVDLDFIVAEAPSDQIELSGGWGAGQLVGTLGLSFNNFSIKNLFKKSAWTPLPSGDGQKLSIRVQSNGARFQSYMFNFTEPWLGGKKPISFSVFANHTVYNYAAGTSNQPGDVKLITTTAGLSVGKQLKWPDDYFQILFSLAYQRYEAQNYLLFSSTGQSFTGVSNNINFTAQISRNSTNDWIFPSSGSMFQASVEATLPYSQMFGWDLSNATLAQKYNWLEYHKWKLKGQWFIPLTKNEKFVLMARGEMGFLGYYNPQIGTTLFERFFLGGSGLTGFNIDGRDIVALRGYSDNALTPGYTGSSNSATGGAFYTKYTMEFRYLISPNPQSKIYALAFLEAGNAWYDIAEFQPFKLNRSAGVGVRIFLPMFGLLGLDYGWGFDPVRNVNESQRQVGQFHFMIGQQF